MQAQKLRTFNDFLKRAEFIHHALLIITEDNSQDCNLAIKDLRALNFNLPFYELNLSDNPNLRQELFELYGIDVLPTFIYFREKKIVSKTVGYSEIKQLSHFLLSATSQLNP